MVTTIGLSDSAAVTSTVVRSYARRFALNLAATNRVRAENNVLTRNREAINFGSVPANYSLLGNDIYDNLDFVGLTNKPAVNAA